MHPTPPRTTSPFHQKIADEMLLEAIAQSNSRLAFKALDQGASPDARYPQDCAIPSLTVAMLCAIKYTKPSWLHGDQEPLRRILSACNPHAVDDLGLTVLMHAASERNIPAIDILLSRSNLEATSGDMGEGFDAGWPALFFAVNFNASFYSGSELAEANDEIKRCIDLLATASNLSITSRSGLDAVAAATRFSPNPEITDYLTHVKARLLAFREQSDLSLAARPVDAIIRTTKTL